MVHVSFVANKGKSFLVVFPKVYRYANGNYYKLYIGAEKFTDIQIRSPVSYNYHK